MLAGRRLAAGAAVVALAIGIGAGVLIGHFAWDRSGGSARSRATPARTAGAPPGRLDANLHAVVGAPRVHNLFWDSTWNTDHPSLTIPLIATATTTILAPSYLSSLAQYGVAGQSFGGSFGPDTRCGPPKAPASVTAEAVHLWVTCMVGNPLNTVPKPRPGVPVSNDMYVVYLPAGTAVSDNFSVPAFGVGGLTFGPYTLFTRTSCVSFLAYHFFSSFVVQPFAYAVVPAQCAGRAMSALTPMTSHEIVEAITDPLIGAGFIDNSIGNAPPAFTRLLAGEAADICSGAGAVPTAGTVNRSGFTLVRFWSNAAGACRPLPP